MNDTAELTRQYGRDGMSPEVKRIFRRIVVDFAAGNYRRLPWRETNDPYRIMVSEVMLQQTQVDRVVEKYLLFIETFPNVTSLAAASLQQVLALWQGLGYNRRGKALHDAARLIVDQWDGRMPTAREELTTLPGIGPYTAAAVAVFAYNQPLPLIETNIRAVYLHFFFEDREGINDREILPLIEATLDRRNPRRWFNSLMDYGAMLKRAESNPSRRSAHHTRQTPFNGSNRQLRGKLIKSLLSKGEASEAELARTVSCPTPLVRKVLEQLSGEGLVREEGPCWRIA